MTVYLDKSKQRASYENYFTNNYLENIGTRKRELSGKAMPVCGKPVASTGEQGIGVQEVSW